MTRIIKVVIADDSPLILNILNKILSSDPLISVVGLASNGLEAFELIRKKKPDVLCTDLYMPKMNGLELTQKLMVENPLPVLVISVASDKESSMELLGAGALDVVAKPLGGFKLESVGAQQLIRKVKTIAGIKVIRKRVPSVRQQSSNLEKPAVVTIGGSTGAPQVFHEIFGLIPKHYPLPILCVQHISVGFLEPFVGWLNKNSHLQVQIAKADTVPQPGCVYFPKENTHMTVNDHGRLQCLDTEPEASHRPAINQLFRSLPLYYQANVLAVLLTGMGEDGAKGLKVLRDAGAQTIAQDQKTSVVFGMPAVAINLGAAGSILPPAKIIEAILLYGQKFSHRAN